MDRIQLTDVPRVKTISKEDFIRDHYRPQRPVLIENLTWDWPAREKWDLAHMRAMAGDQVVPLYNNKPATGKQSVYAPVAEMPLSEYIDILEAGPTDLRIFFYNILDRKPELLKDFDYPDIGLKFFKRLPALFFGGGRSKVFMHYDIDLPDSLHFHFHGNKSVTLFGPEQTKYLYRVPFAIHNLESIDMDAPDFARFPALRHARGQHAHMRHGDALYMPSGYWHYIKYLDAGFSLTLRALPRSPGRAANMLYNVMLMRHFDNLMRRMLGQKWLDKKNRWAQERTEKWLNKEQP